MSLRIYKNKKPDINILNNSIFEENIKQKKPGRRRKEEQDKNNNKINIYFNLKEIEAISKKNINNMPTAIFLKQIILNNI